MFLKGECPAGPITALCPQIRSSATCFSLCPGAASSSRLILRLPHPTASCEQPMQDQGGQASAGPGRSSRSMLSWFGCVSCGGCSNSRVSSVNLPADRLACNASSESRLLDSDQITSFLCPSSQRRDGSSLLPM